MLKIRLARTGRKNAPLYTIVATDHRSCRDGKHLAKLGNFNPQNDKNPLTGLELKEIKAWVEKGAEMSDTIRTLFKRNKITLG